MSQPKTIRVSAKCSDLCFVAIEDEQGETIRECDGYVPYDIGIGGGDYVDLDIDIETGQILNWKKPTKESLKLKD